MLKFPFDFDVVCDQEPANLPKPGGDNPVIGKCRKCGIELHRAMWYCCMEQSCPSGLGSKAHL
jgi:hypothetical protein